MEPDTRNSGIEHLHTVKILILAMPSMGKRSISEGMVFSASTVDEHHQFRPDSWVPTETVSDRTQRQRTENICVFCTACIRAQREEDGRKNLGVCLANCTRNER